MLSWDITISLDCQLHSWSGDRVTLIRWLLSLIIHATDAMSLWYTYLNGDFWMTIKRYNNILEYETFAAPLSPIMITQKGRKFTDKLGELSLLHHLYNLFKQSNFSLKKPLSIIIFLKFSSCRRFSMCLLLILMWSKAPVLLILPLTFKKTTLRSMISSQISTTDHGLKTSSTKSKATLFGMHYVISQSHSTLSMYVSCTIPALLTLMLKPLVEALETVTLGLLSMQHPFKLLFIFHNQITILKPLLKKDASLFV